MTEKRKVSKNFIWAGLSFLLAVFTVAMVLRQSEELSAGELFEILAASDKRFLIAGIIASALYVFFEGMALCSILKSAGYRRRLENGIVYSTSDVFFSAITPSATGGQPASAYFMINNGIPMGITTATLLLNLVMYTVSVIVLGAGSILISPRSFMEFSFLSRLLIFAGFAALSVLALLFLLLLKKEDLIFGSLAKIITFLYNKGIVREKERKLARLEKSKADFKICAGLIGGRRSVVLKAFLWNFLQRASQILVPMLIYASLGGACSYMPAVFAKQCLITVGYNFIPIPGGMGVSDYLMIDGFSRMMNEEMTYSVELISRGFAFYICVAVSGLITLVGYFMGRKRNDRGL